MTESDWLTATDPTEMLESLRGKASDRELRLFAVACCQRVGHLLVEEACRRAVALAERLADGMASRQEVEQTVAQATASAQTWDDEGWGSLERAAKWSAMQSAILSLNNAPAAMGAHAHAARGMGFHIGTPADGASQKAFQAWSVLRGKPGEHEALTIWAAESEKVNAIHTSATNQESGEQCHLLRDIIGNPFRPINIEPSWRTFAVLALAKQAYESRDFTTAPILADALQDAGCDDATILGHLRSETQHVRGCFAVDALLGKE